MKSMLNVLVPSMTAVSTADRRLCTATALLLVPYRYLLKAHVATVPCWYPVGTLDCTYYWHELWSVPWYPVGSPYPVGTPTQDADIVRAGGRLLSVRHVCTRQTYEPFLDIDHGPFRRGEGYTPRRCRLCCDPHGPGYVFLHHNGLNHHSRRVHKSTDEWASSQAEARGVVRDWLTANKAHHRQPISTSVYKNKDIVNQTIDWYDNDTVTPCILLCHSSWYEDWPVLGLPELQSSDETSCCSQRWTSPVLLGAWSLHPRCSVWPAGNSANKSEFISDTPVCWWTSGWIGASFHVNTGCSWDAALLLPFMAGDTCATSSLPTL